MRLGYDGGVVLFWVSRIGSGSCVGKLGDQGCRKMDNEMMRLANYTCIYTDYIPM